MVLPFWFLTERQRERQKSENTLPIFSVVLLVHSTNSTRHSGLHIILRSTSAICTNEYVAQPREHHRGRGDSLSNTTTCCCCAESVEQVSSKGFEHAHCECCPSFFASCVYIFVVVILRVWNTENEIYYSSTRRVPTYSYIVKEIFCC